MRSLSLLIGVLVATAGFCDARVGETLDEINRRYGDGHKREPGASRFFETEQYDYEKNGFAIEVILAGQRSICEVFRRLENVVTDEDIKALLSVNKEGSSWYFMKKADQWMRNDHKLCAFRQPGHKEYFFIQDIAAIKKSEYAKLEAQKKIISPVKTDGF